MKRPPVNEDKELADEDDNLSEDSGASDSYSGDDNYIDGNIAGEEAEDAEDMNAQGNDVLSGSMDEKSLSNNSRQQPTAAGAAARRKGAKKNKGGAGGKTGKSGGSNKGGGVGGGRGGGSRGKGSNGAGTTRGNKHSRNNTTNNNVTTTTNKASLNREDSNDDFNDPSYKDKNKDNAGQTAVIRFSHKPSAAFRLTGSQMNLMNSSASRGFVGVSQSESYMKFLTGSVKKVKAVIDRNIMERASKEFSGSKTLGSNINLNSSSNSRGGGGNNTTARGAGGKQSAAANVFTVGKPPVIEKISIEEERMREAEMARERELYKLRRSDPIKFRRVIRRERAKEYIAQKWQRLQAIRVNIITCMQSLKFHCEELEILKEENKNLSELLQKTKHDVNNFISSKLEDNETSERQAKTLFQEYISLRKRLKRETKQNERHCNEERGVFERKYNEVLTQFTEMSKEGDVLVDFKNVSENDPEKLKQTIQELTELMKMMKAREQKILKAMDEKLQTDKHEIERVMYEKIGAVGTGMGKRLLKYANTRTPLSEAYRSNIRIKKEIQMHNANQESAESELQELERKRMDLSTRLDGVKRGLMTVEKNEVGANELKPLSEAVDKDRGRSLRAFTLGAGGLDSRRRVLDLKKWMTCTPETEIILN